MTILAVFSTSCAQSSKEEIFWKWFQTNESRLFEFEEDQERIFDDLQHELQKVHPNLTFEFGPKDDGKREFVISADGITDAFPSVIVLADKAPPLRRWTIFKFRQRRGTRSYIEFEGTRVRSDDVKFTIEPDGNKAGITLFMEGYGQGRDRQFAGIGFLFLDQCLGEYDVETKVGFVEFRPASGQTDLAKRPLSELSEAFDEFVGSRRN
jgi:hypothetical protein